MKKNIIKKIKCKRHEKNRHKTKKYIEKWSSELAAEKLKNTTNNKENALTILLDRPTVGAL